ncbi:MAG TPA: hypothetical protein VGI33_09190 [Paenibacillus sp.]|jgi:hypothetical protein
MGGQAITINIPPVEKWTLRDLKSVCRHNKIKGYTKMSREQLIVHVREILGHMESSTKQSFE